MRDRIQVRDDVLMFNTRVRSRLPDRRPGSWEGRPARSVLQAHLFQKRGESGISAEPVEFGIDLHRG